MREGNEEIHNYASCCDSSGNRRVRVRLKYHEWLSATECKDRQGKPYWRIDGRGDKNYCLEEIEFCKPEEIRSKLRHNDAIIIDWFTDKEAGTVSEAKSDLPVKLEPGCNVVWSQQRTWGGKQSVPATFIEYRGKASARIRIGDSEKTVKVKSLARL